MAYAIVAAQGWYGAHTTVVRAFESLDAADTYARSGKRAVLAAELCVGERVHAIDAKRYEARADAIRDRLAVAMALPQRSVAEWERREAAMVAAQEV